MKMGTSMTTQEAESVICVDRTSQVEEQKRSARPTLVIQSHKPKAVPKTSRPALPRAPLLSQKKKPPRLRAALGHKAQLTNCGSINPQSGDGSDKSRRAQKPGSVQCQSNVATPTKQLSPALTPTPTTRLPVHSQKTAMSPKSPTGAYERKKIRKLFQVATERLRQQQTALASQIEVQNQTFRALQEKFGTLHRILSRCRIITSQQKAV